MKYGFIYIWRDRKHDRYYIGSHWGTEQDGYVCSSSWMLQAYKKRPQDFKRRILEKFEDRSKINEIEHRWLQMIKTEEIKKRYYNLSNRRFGHWSTTDETRRIVSAKCGDLKRGHRWTPEQKMKLKGRTPWNKGKSGYSIKIKEDDPRKGRPTWNAGTAKHKVLKGRSGRVVSDTTREKQRLAKIGLTHSEETKKKISASKIGSTPWNKGKIGVSEETREKMRQSAINRRTRR